METWKQYRDTIYEVSDLGNVRNRITGKIKSKFKKNNGKKENDYLRVALHIKGEKKTVAVHRMVAECYLKDFDDKLEVNHINSLRYDNRVCNLEMTTKEENYQHSIKYGGGVQRKPVFAIDEKGNKIEFQSLWAGARFIKDNKGIERDLDHICSNIKQSIKGNCKNAYGYKWSWESPEYNKIKKGSVKNGI